MNDVFVFQLEVEGAGWGYAIGREIAAMVESCWPSCPTLLDRHWPILERD